MLECVNINIILEVLNMKIVVNTYPFQNTGLLKLKEDFKELDFAFVNSVDELPDALNDADALITFLLKKELIEKAGKLKWIQALSAGVDFYPLNYIQENNIALTTGKGVHKIHMSEYAISMLIIAARRIDTMIINQTKSLWNQGIPQEEIYGKKLGIIGLGSIGKEIAKKAAVMGMEVYGIKNTVAPVESVKEVYSIDKLDIIAKNCDYIINLLPHTPETNKIIDSSFFDLLKSNAVVLNMGRGGTVNEQDLLSALTDRKFRLYISDVFEKEPLPEDNPLWKLDNIVITPHLCGPNTHYLDKAYVIIKKNIENLLEGKDLENIYSFVKGY